MNRRVANYLQGMTTDVKENKKSKVPHPTFRAFALN
jgi:hypothetical protein